MPSTAQKIRIARGVLATLRTLGFATRRQATRHGVTFDLDLNEGIDLSLFLFGSFQQHVLSVARRFLEPHSTVIDVGANIGSMTLPLAGLVPRGRIYAFEPSDFAFAKLQRNLALNPHLADRVTPAQCFVADTARTDSELVAYSSWPLTGGESGADHPIHKGRPMPTRGGQVTLDQFARASDLSDLRLIKIDTDGHEYAVLNGAHGVLQRLRPVVVFEACEYLMKPPRPTFTEFEALFASHDYRICGGRALRPMTARAFEAACPRGGSLDLVAIPRER